MKPLAVFFLLLIHLFSIGVYSGAFNQSFDVSGGQMVKRYCTEKERKNLIELKIPISIPGVAAWTAYEKIRGEIKLKNAEYVYVSLKMSRDTMYLLCMPHSNKSKSLNANIIQAKNIADVAAGNKTNNSSAKKTLDVQFKGSIYEHNNLICFERNKKTAPGSHSIPLTPYLETAGQPPDHSC